MTKILKPNHCDQNWLEMTPTNGGRICEKCNKRIVDFSKMNWAQIERIQNQNNNAVCGMYNHKQLENWGHELPTFSNSIKKAAQMPKQLSRLKVLLLKGKSLTKKTMT